MQKRKYDRLVTIHYIIICKYHFIREDKFYPAYLKINLSCGSLCKDDQKNNYGKIFSRANKGCKILHMNILQSLSEVKCIRFKHRVKPFL